MKCGQSKGVFNIHTKWQDREGIDPIQENDPALSIADKWKSVTAFHYLDIPIKGNLTVGKRKVRFIASVGMAVNIYLTNSKTAVTKTEDGSATRSKSKDSNNQPLNFSPLISVGMDYRINDRMSLCFEPTFRHSILKLSGDSYTISDQYGSRHYYSYNTYLWSAGLNISWYFGL